MAIPFRSKRWVPILILVFIFGLLASYVFVPKRNIPVLMYHFILPDSDIGTNSLKVGVRQFEHQMKFLRAFGFRPVSIDEYDAIRTGSQKPKGREVLITFDDGDRSYIQHALPVLERYQIPSINFLIWDHLNDPMWKDYMTLDEIKRIVDHPLVWFGSHTLSHPKLKEISLDEAWVEIKESKEKLEGALNRPILDFCYPGGSFNEPVMELVQRAGYRLAFRAAMKHLTGYPETLYSLARIKVSPRQNLFVFWLNVSGLVDYAKRIEAFFRRLTANKLNGTLQFYKPRQETM